VIYFVQPLEGGPVNIGHARNVTKRLIELQGYYRRPLVLLSTIEGGRGEEQALHVKFAHLRLGRAALFRPSTELMEFIGCPGELRSSRRRAHPGGQVKRPRPQDGGEAR
jgi:hypothetical protein